MLKFSAACAAAMIIAAAPLAAISATIPHSPAPTARTLVAFAAAGMLFSKPGRWQRVSFADSSVRATIAYRTRHDLSDGPVSVGNIISDFRLRIDTSGPHRLNRTYTARDISLAGFYLLPDSGPSCGAVVPMVRRGRYLAISIVAVGKGCGAFARFIDLQSGLPAEMPVVDYRPRHRFDIPPPAFRPRAVMTVARIDTVAVPVDHYDGRSSGPLRGVDIYTLLHLRGPHAENRLVQTMREPGEPPFQSGETVTLGALEFVERGDRTAALRRAEPQQERFRDAMPALSPAQVRERFRSAYEGNSFRRVWRGDLAGAADAYAMMLDYVDDPAQAEREKAVLQSCRRVVNAVHAGRLKARIAIEGWTHGGCEEAARAIR